MKMILLIFLPLPVNAIRYDTIGHHYSQFNSILYFGSYISRVYVLFYVNMHLVACMNDSFGFEHVSAARRVAVLSTRTRLQITPLQHYMNRMHCEGICNLYVMMNSGCPESMEWGEEWLWCYCRSRIIIADTYTKASLKPHNMSDTHSHRV